MAHWYDETEIPLAPMPVPVANAAYTVHNGRLWVIGGLGANSFSDRSRAVQVYDPSVDAWEIRGEYPLEGGSTPDVGSACSDGTRIWFTTATLYGVALYAFDPADDTFTRYANFPIGINQSASLLHYDGKLYFGMHNAPFAYDIATDTWAELTRATHWDSRGGARSVLDEDAGIIYSTFLNADRIGSYHIATDTWTQFSSSGGQARIYSFAFFRDGLMHLLGGETQYSSNPSSSWVVYDPATNTVSTTDPMPIPLKRMAGGWINGQMFLFGGTTVASNLAQDVRLMYAGAYFQSLRVSYRMPVPFVAELPVRYDMRPPPPAAVARFWRLRVLEQPSQWVTVRSAEFREQPGGANIATNPANAIGTPGSDFATVFTEGPPPFEVDSPGGWFGYDFGNPVSVRQVSLTAMYESEMPTHWAVETSSDGAAWELVTEIEDPVPWDNEGDVRTYDLVFEYPGFQVVQHLDVTYAMPLPPVEQLTGQWVDLAAHIQVPASLQNAIEFRSTFDAQGGRIMLIGAVSPDPETPPVGKVAVLDVATGVWADLPDLPGVPYGTGTSPFFSGLALIPISAGGPPAWYALPFDGSAPAEPFPGLPAQVYGLDSFFDGRDPLNPTFYFDVASEQPMRRNLVAGVNEPLTPWQHATASPYENQGSAHDPETGRIYVIVNGHFAVYDPDADVWTDLPDAPVDLNGFSLEFALGHVIMFSGASFDTFELSDRTWFYSVQTNEWSPGPSMLTERVMGASIAMPDSILALGGLTDLQPTGPMEFTRHMLVLELETVAPAVIEYLDVTYRMSTPPPADGDDASIIRYLSVTHRGRSADSLSITQFLPAYYRMRGTHVKDLTVQYGMVLRNGPQDPLPGPGLPPGERIPPAALPDPNAPSIEILVETRP